jgi:shikimate 5-dehydrogenase
MNTAFYYYGLNKIYKSFSVDNIEDAIKSVLTLDIKGFAVTMPYKVKVLRYVHDKKDSVREIGSANTVLNTNGRLTAYNTDSYAATIFLDGYDNRKKLYIVGDGGYARAVTWAAEDCRFHVESVTRENWNELYDIRDSVVYNCTPVDITDMIHKSNDFINCLVETETGKKLARLQASKQFELYTGKEFPL